MQDAEGESRVLFLASPVMTATNMIARNLNDDLVMTNASAYFNEVHDFSQRNPKVSSNEHGTEYDSN